MAMRSHAVRLIAQVILASLLALLNSCHRGGHDGWTCAWIDGPRASGTSGAACTGVVSCRHESMQTLIPQIRGVSCPKSNDACDAAACFVESIRTK